MIDGVGSTNEALRLTGTRSAATPGQTKAVQGGVDGRVPPSPPPEVLDALDTAARVLEGLRAAQVSLRFSVEGEGALRQVKVEVRDGNGALVREIPPQRLLDVLSGDAQGFAVDAQG